MLKCGDGLQPEMLDIVVHHHEYLDGSGYPHGLQAREISISCASRRSATSTARWSKSAPTSRRLSSQKAYEIMREMGPKLDKDLVREFGFVMKAA